MYAWASIYHDAAVIVKSVAEQPKKDQSFQTISYKMTKSPVPLVLVKSEYKNDIISV